MNDHTGDDINNDAVRQYNWKMRDARIRTPKQMLSENS